VKLGGGGVKWRNAESKTAKAEMTASCLAAYRQ